MRKNILIHLQILVALLFFGSCCSGKMAGDMQLRFGNYDGAVQDFQEAVFFFLYVLHPVLFLSFGGSPYLGRGKENF
jgi:hypothetical protein